MLLRHEERTYCTLHSGRKFIEGSSVPSSCPPEPHTGYAVASMGVKTSIKAKGGGRGVCSDIGGLMDSKVDHIL
jgi:hypothetical protein